MAALLRLLLRLGRPTKCSHHGALRLETLEPHAGSIDAPAHQIPLMPLVRPEACSLPDVAAHQRPTVRAELGLSGDIDDPARNALESSRGVAPSASVKALDDSKDEALGLINRLVPVEHSHSGLRDRWPDSERRRPEDRGSWA